LDKITRLYKSRDDIMDLAQKNYEESHDAWNEIMPWSWPMIKETAAIGGAKFALLKVLKKYAAGALPPVEAAVGVVGTAETAQEVYGAARDIAHGEEEYDATMQKVAELDKEIEEAIKQLEECRKQHGMSSAFSDEFVFVSLQTAKPDLAKARASLIQDARIIAASRDYPGAKAGAQPVRPYQETLKHLEAAISALKEASTQLESASGKKVGAGMKPPRPQGDLNETLTPAERTKITTLVAGPLLLRAFDELNAAYTTARTQSEHDESVLKMMRARSNS
jgi:hypothetical protein